MCYTVTRCTLKMYVRSVQYSTVQYSTVYVAQNICEQVTYALYELLLVIQNHLCNHPDALATALADAEAGPPFDWAVALA
jgi:hypothetical protein